MTVLKLSSLDAKVIKLVMKLSEMYYLKSSLLGVLLSNTFDNVILSRPVSLKNNLDPRNSFSTIDHMIVVTPT